MVPQNNNPNISKDENEYTITEIFYVLKKHTRIILVCFLLVFLSAILYTMISKPIYESSSVIMVGEEQGSMSILDIGLAQDRNFIENEIQILNSRTTSDLAVKQLFNNGYENNLYLFGTKKYEPNIYRKLLTFGLLDRFEAVNSIINLDNDMFNSFSDQLRNSINISKSSLHLPSSTYLSASEIKFICNKIKLFFKRNH